MSAPRKLFAGLVGATLLSGCAPYVGYTHLSDPFVEGDGYDLICAGGELGNKLRADLGVCKNVHGGKFARFDLRYRFDIPE